MANSVTSICSQALGLIGATRIDDFDTDSSSQAILCRLQYEPTRDALMRLFRWRFAAARSQLSQDSTDPDFEYDNQFILPSDFIGLRSVYGDNFTATGNTKITYAIEGDRILTNESSVDLRYTKLVTDVSKFDPLFVKVLVVSLADEFIGPLAGGDKRIQDKIDRRMKALMTKARAVDRQETNTIGREAHRPWVEAHLSGGGASFRGRT